MKAGDLVTLGKQGEEELIIGVVVDVCLPDDHPNGMHLIQALHEDKTTWWPGVFVRKINESR